MQDYSTLGVRRFGRVNWLGLATLIEREIRRFATVWTQTLLAPLVTTGLFLTVFTLAIGPRRGEVMGVSFVEFLIPGILTMTVIQNAFANTSSSIVIAKVQGNIVDSLMPPLSAAELVTGYIAGGLVRGIIVALAITVAVGLTLGVFPAHPFVALGFVVMGAGLLSALGVIAAIFANKFDQMAALTNFIIVPLSFLSGTFYSIEGLPKVLQILTHLNPIFYLIDGVRYGFIGASDSAPFLGAMVVFSTFACVAGLAWYWFKIGYRIKP